MYQVKYKKSSIHRNWTDCDYRVQDSKDVSHTTKNISCSTTQFLVFPFCGPHIKPNDLSSLASHLRQHRILSNEILKECVTVCRFKDPFTHSHLESKIVQVQLGVETPLPHNGKIHDNCETNNNNNNNNPLVFWVCKVIIISF